MLTKTVFRHICEGSTQLAAFAEAAEHLQRTAAACGFRWNSDVRKHYESQIRQAKLERQKHKAGNSRKRAETTSSNHSNTEILVTVSQVTEQKNVSSQYLDQIINLAQNQKLHLANMAKQIKRLNEQLSEKESEV